ncbi:MAG: discoidin domain-containing protein, partial [Muribaculaceae bacterium]|nr:discoidin domain-containing protein [Muribaculaceae bacterium]
PDTLATISEEPYRLYTTVTSKSDKPYRYVRYRGADNSYCNIAELAFYTGEQPLPGKAIGTDKPWGGVTNRGIQAVFDGDPYTSFDYSEPSGGWVGLDLGNPKRIDRIVYTPRNRDNFIRTGDQYELFYWESAQNKWRSLGSKTATADSIDFQSPLGALLYLKNHTRGNDERIFLYDHNAKRQIFY